MFDFFTYFVKSVLIGAEVPRDTQVVNLLREASAVLLGLNRPLQEPHIEN
jgi:hypothetical protein